MTTRRLRIGILGASAFARRAIIPAIGALGEHYALAGVASRTRDAAAAAVEGTDGVAFEGYDAILDDGRLDAVYIPLPNGLHFEWARKALDRDIHVLVEKSLACSHEEVVALTELAQERDLALMENFQFRFHTQLARIRSMLDGGELGELRAVRSSFGFPPFADRDNIRYQPALGGGALLDVGAYTVKISQLFLGPDLDVAASRLTHDATTGVDVAGGGFLVQRGGDLFSEVAFGFDHAYQCSLELWGSRARLTTNRIFTAPATLAPELLVESANGSEVIRLEPDDHFRSMLLHFHGLVVEGGGREQEHADNINQARLLAAMRSKADER